MAKFSVPSQYQQRVLLVGVLIALVLRAIFIAAGAAIIASFAWVFYIFGAFLIYTAWKLIQEARADDEDEEFEENKLLKAAEKRFGVADRYHGTKLCIQENGKRVMTPMMVVMLAIGTTDVLFALDSIPAIFGLTQDPYIVFTANAFALMGLRQLYFLIGGLLRKLVHLSYGLSVILGFIGVKLVLHALHESGVHVPEISIPVSLGVICAVLIVTTITSLIASKKQAAREAAEADAAASDRRTSRPSRPSRASRPTRPIPRRTASRPDGGRAAQGCPVPDGVAQHSGRYLLVRGVSIGHGAWSSRPSLPRRALSPAPRHPATPATPPVCTPPVGQGHRLPGVRQAGTASGGSAVPVRAAAGRVSGSSAKHPRLSSAIAVRYAATPQGTRPPCSASAVATIGVSAPPSTPPRL